MKTALIYYRYSIAILKNSDEKALLSPMINIASAYSIIGDFTSTKTVYNEVFHIQKKLNNEKGIVDILIAKATKNVTKNVDSNIVFLNQALVIAKKINDDVNIIEILVLLGQIKSDNKSYIDASIYFNKALVLAKQKHIKHVMPNIMNGISDVELSKKNHKKAITYQQAALDLVRSSVSDRRKEIFYLNNLSELHFSLKHYDEAKSLAKQVLELGKNTNGIYPELNSASDMLYNVYMQEHDYKSALEAYQLKTNYITLYENEEYKKTKIRNELQQQYDVLESKITAEKQQETIKLNAQKTINKFFIGGVILLLLLVGFITKNLLDNKRSAKLISAQHTQLEEKQKEIVDSIHYAQRIQHSLLASHELLQQHLPEFFVLYKPKDIVSGDFYWATTKVENGSTTFYMAICDSTGHGVPGALMSVLNSSFLNEGINEKNIDAPNAILNHVRKQLVNAFKKDLSTSGGQDGMDGVLLKFDKAANELQFSGANNSLVLIRNTEITEYNGDKMPVGKSPKQDVSFTLQTVSLQAHDVCYAFTDGFADQFGGPNQKKYKHKNLLAFLKDIHELPLEQQHKRLEHEFLTWKGNEEQIDDLLIVGFRV